MKVQLDLTDAERLAASLGLSIADCLALAQSEPEQSFPHLQDASAFAHTLARLLDRLSEAVAGETPIVMDEDAKPGDLRVAVARRASVVPIRPEPA